MSTIVQTLFPGPYALPAANFAVPDVRQGTNFPVPILRFATDTTAFLFFEALNYGSGPINCGFFWYAETATSGDVVLGGSLVAFTPGVGSGTGDTTDIEGRSFDTEQTVTDTHLGTTGKRLHRADLAMTNLDALVSGDWTCFRVARKSSGNTMSGTLGLAAVVLSYSDI